LELAADEQRESEAQRRAHAGALARALGDAEPKDDAELRPWLERAKAELARRRALAERRARIEHELERAVAQRGVAARAVEERKRELADWRDEWTAAMTPFGLGGDAGTDEAAAVLVLADELTRKLETARGLERRIDGIERDARALEADVCGWVERHAPDLAGRAFQDAGAELVQRHQSARLAATRRQDVERRIHKLREQLVELRDTRERAEAELKALIAAAGVSSADELPAAELASRRATELEQELSTIERELGEIRSGVSLETLIAETQGTDVDQARVRLGEVDQELDELEEQRDAVREQIATTRAGLDRLDNSTAAAEAAAEAMAHAARIRQDVERYARVRLAEIVLSRQVERYREKNQGPLVERTSSLFPRLTHGRYSGVRVDVDAGDEPVLRCVRADGHLVDVEGLSEGTRDQLYLALRLASLERHAELGHPLPLVLDDVLVHFDEQRTAAALEALGELSTHLQILLFTHHDHVVEAARAVISSERLNVHTLNRPALPPRVEPTARA